MSEDVPLVGQPAVSPRLEPRDRLFQPLTPLNPGSAPAVANQPSTDPAFTLNMEEAVIGTCLAFGDAPYQIMDVLRQEHFLDPALGTTWKAITDMIAVNRKVDVFSIRSYIDQQGLADLVPPQARLVTMSLEAISPDHVRSYAEDVIEGFGARNLLTAAQRVGQIARQPGAVKLRFALASEEILQAETQSFSALQKGPRPIHLSIRALTDQITLAAQAGGVTGLALGLRPLDIALGGVGRDDLLIIAGRPSMGKSAIALNFADDISTNVGRVLFFSGEMSSTQLLARLIATRARINTIAMRTGNLTQLEWDRYTTAAGRISQNDNLIIDDRGRPELSQILATSRSQHARNPLAAIVVDHIQLISVPGLEENRNLAIGTISGSLKGLAKDLHVPVIALSQLNRGVETRDNKRPRMSDLRESGSVEQDADSVVFTYRDEYYYPERPDVQGLAELIIAKSRHAQTQTIHVRFEGAYSQFSELEEGFQPPRTNTPALANF